MVLKATTKEPTQRYASVEEMREDLLTSLSPAKRNEPVFVPADLSEEDTLVLDIDKIKDETNLQDNGADENTVAGPTTETPEEKPKKKRRWWLLLISVALITFFIIFLLTRPEQVVVPDELIGMTEEEAIEELESLNLVLGEIHEQSNDDYEEGIVFRVNPNTGSTVLEGAEIDLYVSLGEVPFEVEDYEGEVFDEVRAELDELGFTVEETERETHETIPVGQIIRQDIEPGTEVIASETTITFTVSSGRPFVELADLSRHSRKGVEDYANANGLVLTIHEESSEEVPFDLVIRQSPEEGTEMYAGDELTVVISTGPEELEEIAFSEQITIPYAQRLEDPHDEESDLLPNTIEIYIEDLRNDFHTPVRTMEIFEDTPYTFNFVVLEGESARYQIRRDGQNLVTEVVTPD